jgi:hypothetical protein
MVEEEVRLSGGTSRLIPFGQLVKEGEAAAQERASYPNNNVTVNATWGAAERARGKPRRAALKLSASGSRINPNLLDRWRLILAE